jgi:hypothetical protein
MEENVKSFLDKIQEFKEVKTKVYVNSIKKELECVNLSFKQQKNLISTIGDGAIGALKFQKVINDIIIENTGKSDILVSDKLAIIVKLRVDSIGNKITRDEEDVDIIPILENLKKIKYDIQQSVVGSVKVTLKVPTLAAESKVIQAAIDSVKKDETEFGKNVGNIYTYEILKYVDKLEIGEDVLELSQLPIKDRFKVVENLPINTNKAIIAFIQEMKNKEVDALTYNTNKVLEVDVSFFDS